MPGTEINLYGTGDVDLSALMTTTDKQRISYMALSLSNYDNDNEPAIAAGSFVEVGGTLFQFGVEEAITGWAGIGNDTDAYIKIVPAGVTPDTVTAEFTDTAPTWSDAKQGWYGTVAAANHRYVAGVKRGTGAADFWEKYIIKWQAGELATKIIRIGDWNMDTTASLTVVHGLGAAWKNVRNMSARIRDDNDIYYHPLDRFDDAADPTLLQGGITYTDVTDIILIRRSGSGFDNVLYDSTSYNRGWVYIEYVI